MTKESVHIMNLVNLLKHCITKSSTCDKQDNLDSLIQLYPDLILLDHLMDIYNIKYVDIVSIYNKGDELEATVNGTYNHSGGIIEFNNIKFNLRNKNIGSTTVFYIKEV